MNIEQIQEFKQGKFVIKYESYAIDMLENILSNMGIVNFYQRASTYPNHCYILVSSGSRVYTYDNSDLTLFSDKKIITFEELYSLKPLNILIKECIKNL